MAFSTQEILEEFAEANGAEERELRAVYVIRRLKFQRRAGGKYGIAPRAYFKPTLSAAGLRGVHWALVPPVVVPKIAPLPKEACCIRCRREFGTAFGVTAHYARGKSLCEILERQGR